MTNSGTLHHSAPPGAFRPARCTGFVYRSHGSWWVSPRLRPGEQALVGYRVLRGKGGGHVVVASSADTAYVKAVLGPHLGRALIVVACPWSAPEFDAAGDELTRHAGRLALLTQGHHVSPEGHTIHVVCAKHLSPELVTWHQQWTPGLVSLRAWIRPTDP